MVRRSLHSVGDEGEDVVGADSVDHPASFPQPADVGVDVGKGEPYAPAFICVARLISASEASVSLYMTPSMSMTTACTGDPKAETCSLIPSWKPLALAKNMGHVQVSAGLGILSHSAQRRFGGDHRLDVIRRVLFDQPEQPQGQSRPDDNHR